MYVNRGGWILSSILHGGQLCQRVDNYVTSYPVVFVLHTLAKNSNWWDADQLGVTSVPEEMKLGIAM